MISVFLVRAHDSRPYSRLHLFKMAKPICLLTCSLALVTSAHIVSHPNNDTSYIDIISEYVESISDDLWNISRTIHDNPELGFKEVKAHDLLTSFMEVQVGWTVTKSLHNISTAFSAVFEGSGDGPVVSFNSEYGNFERND
jgi:hypothetical protein